MQSTEIGVSVYTHDADYDAFLDRIQARFVANTKDKPVFQTDAEGLWWAYLDSFPSEARQYHNCHCCKTFIERFGSLVTIGEDGLTESALWNEEDASPAYLGALKEMSRLARRAKVVGPFLSSEDSWGQRVTGEWHHLSLKPTAVYRRAVLTAGQAMAEKREDYRNVQYALKEFTQPMLEQALTLLKTDSLYRSERVIGPAQWLYALHVARKAAKSGGNAVWRAIATAPAGFCHPRSSMIGTLLEDIAAGMDFSEVSRRFAAKMAPLAYQRPQAAPTAGAILQAERLMADLGAAGALARRYARPEELQALWVPIPATAKATGVFGHLNAKAGGPADLAVSVQAITWEKFRRTVLPVAEGIEVYAPGGNAGYYVHTTAVNSDAPPIIQWDREDARNPVAWYCWNGGASAQQMGLTIGYHPCLRVTLAPHKWTDEDAHQHQPKFAMFIIDGAKESRQEGMALFPEILRSEFHGIRSVIEAYSRSKQLDGLQDTHAIGLGVSPNGGGVQVRVKTGAVSLVYKIDRWD